MHHLFPKLVAFSVLAAVPAACQPKHPARAPADPSRVVASAVAHMYPSRRSDVHGLVHVRVLEHGVLLRGNFTGLKSGLYGFGIRENGDCSAFDGKSAGGYFVGSAGNKAEPLGRLENLVVERNGGTDFQRSEEKLSMSGPDSVVGKSLVLEAWPYDPKIDPATVPFVACGVIVAE
jgi:Cu-Zn family superoxide dismutase